MRQIDKVRSIAGYLGNALVGSCQDSMGDAEDSNGSDQPETKHQWRKDGCVERENHADAQ